MKTKNTTWQRLLCMFLCCVMLLGMAPAVALAEGDENLPLAAAEPAEADVAQENTASAERSAESSVIPNSDEAIENEEPEETPELPSAQTPEGTQEPTAPEDTENEVSEPADGEESAQTPENDAEQEPAGDTPENPSDEPSEEDRPVIEVPEEEPADDDDIQPIADTPALAEIKAMIDELPASNVTLNTHDKESVISLYKQFVEVMIYYDNVLTAEEQQALKDDPDYSDNFNKFSGAFSPKNGIFYLCYQEPDIVLEFLREELEKLPDVADVAGMNEQEKKDAFAQVKTVEAYYYYLESTAATRAPGELRDELTAMDELVEALEADVRTILIQELQVMINALPSLEALEQSPDAYEAQVNEAYALFNQLFADTVYTDILRELGTSYYNKLMELVGYYSYADALDIVRQIRALKTPDEFNALYFDASDPDEGWEAAQAYFFENVLEVYDNYLELDETEQAALEDVYQAEYNWLLGNGSSNVRYEYWHKELNGLIFSFAEMVCREIARLENLDSYRETIAPEGRADIYARSLKIWDAYATMTQDKYKYENEDGEKKSDWFTYVAHNFDYPSYTGASEYLTDGYCQDIDQLQVLFNYIDFKEHFVPEGQDLHIGVEDASPVIIYSPNRSAGDYQNVDSSYEAGLTQEDTLWHLYFEKGTSSSCPVYLRFSDDYDMGAGDNLFVMLDRSTPNYSYIFDDMTTIIDTDRYDYDGYDKPTIPGVTHYQYGSSSDPSYIQNDLWIWMTSSESSSGGDGWYAVVGRRNGNVSYKFMDTDGDTVVLEGEDVFFNTDVLANSVQESYDYIAPHPEYMVTQPEGKAVAYWVDQYGIRYTTMYDNLILTPVLGDAWKVTFVDENGNEVGWVNILKDTTPDVYAVPAAARDYGQSTAERVFAGWLDENGNEFGAQPITANTTFTATWAPVEGETALFHRTTRISELEIGVHAIIVYYDYDGIAHTVSPAVSNGNITELPISAEAAATGVGWEVPLSMDSVLTVNGRTGGEYSGESVLRFTSSNGQRLKIGTDSNNFLPLFDKGGGEITLYYNRSSSDYWCISNSHRYLIYDEGSNSSFAHYSARSDTRGPRRPRLAFVWEIWTDADPDAELGDARYVEYPPLDMSPSSVEWGEEMVIVYTDPADGKSYALVTGDLSDGSNAVEVFPEGVSVTTWNGDQMTTILTTSRYNAWTVRDDEWSIRRNPETSLPEYYANQLTQNNQYLWLSDSGAFSTEAKNIYFYTEYGTESEQVKLYLHGPNNEENRYLGWDSATKQFTFLNSREGAVDVRIYGPSRNVTFNNYNRLTDLTQLQYATDFLVVLPLTDPDTGETVRYAIASGSPAFAARNWLLPVTLNADNSITISTGYNSRNAVFTHGALAKKDDGSDKTNNSTYWTFEYISAGNSYWYPQNLSGTSREAPFYHLPKEVRFEYPSTQDTTTIYIRGNGENSYLGVLNGDPSQATINTEFTVVGPDSPNRIPVEIYTVATSDAIRVIYHDTDGEPEADTDGDVYTQRYLATRRVPDIYVKDGEQVPEGTEGSLRYSFVGWTIDEDVFNAKTAYLGWDDSTNLYGYMPDKETNYFREKAREMGLIGSGNQDIANHVDLFEYGFQGAQEVHLYPLYAIRGVDTVVTADEEGVAVVGISDWKALQDPGHGYRVENKEKWLGSVNIEVYKDGEPWVTSTPLYFSYHNDNAVDLNIKFVWDSIKDTFAANGDYYNDLYDRLDYPYLVNDPLYWFMSDTDTFPVYDQVGHFVIDAVYAIQGGSEDGLYYSLNWMTDHGGQLDNVRGGTTVKVYVTTKYDVLYYLDDELITEDAWVNPNTYTTPGTANAFAAAEREAEEALGGIYKVRPDNELSELMQPGSPDEIFDQADILRGNYKGFSYLMHEYEHVIPIAKTPEELVPEGYVLISKDWELKDKAMVTQEHVDWLADYLVGGETATGYGTGNTIHSYKEAVNVSPYEAEAPRTYHLYAYTGLPLGDLTVSKTVTGTAGETEKDFTFTVTLEDKSISGTYGDMTFENGVASFTLKHGESKTATDLPAGVKYTVTESDNEGYTVSQENAEGEIILGETVEAAFTNHKDPEPQYGSLTVSKMVTGTAGDKEKDFTFTVALEDESVNGVYGEMEFVNGTASFTLKDGESKTATGLPADVKYTVTESDNEGYEVTATNGTGTILANETVEAAFVNNKDEEPKPTPTPEPTPTPTPSPEPTPTPTPTPEPTPTPAPTPSPSPSPTPDAPRTGDESRLGLWSLLLAVALTGMAAAAVPVLRRKKKD